MADNEGVKDPGVADQEGEQSQAWEKERMAEISASKNRYKAEAEVAVARVQELENQAAASRAATQTTPATNPDDLSDEQWIAQKFAPTVENAAAKAVREAMAPYQDRVERQEFWDQYPGQDAEVRIQVEALAKQVLANGGTVDRKRVLALVLGERNLIELETAKDIAAAQKGQLEQINAAAQAGTNRTIPVPPKDISDPDEFGKMSADEQWAALNAGGQSAWELLKDRK